MSNVKNFLTRHRWVRWLLTAVAVLFALVIVVAGLAYWRLQQGPIELGFLEPRLDEAFRGTGDAPSVQIRNPVLTWGGWQRPLDLRAGPLRVIDPQGRAIVELGDVSMGLALSPLLRGVVAPTRIEVARLKIQLVRVKDGRIAVGFEARDAAAPSTQSQGSGLSGYINDLLVPPDPDHPLGQLEKVHVLDSRLTWEDQVWDRSWIAANAEVDLIRTPTGLKVSLSLDAAGETEVSGIDITASLERSTKRIEATVELREVDVPTLTRGVPGLEILAMFDFPVNVSVDLVTELNAPPDEDVRRFELGEAIVDLGGDLVLNLRGTAELHDGVVGAGLTASVPGVHVSLLDRYWPEGAVPDVREWLTTNITSGDIRDVEAQVDLTLPVQPAGALRIDGLEGNFAYHDLEVAYLRPMPPVSGVTGVGRVSLRGLEFDVEGGAASDIVLDEARVTIGPLSGHTRLGLKADLHGPLRTALEIIDSKPLELLSPSLPQPVQFSGRAASQLVLDVPLSSSDRVPISVSGTSRTTEAGVVGWPNGYDITAADIDVVFDLEHLEFQGGAQLNGVPVDVRWWESLADGPLKREAKAIANLTDAYRRAIGIPDIAPITGPIGLDLDLTQPADAPMKLELVADLAGATLSVPQLGWSKPQGVPGLARIDATVGEDSAVKVDRFDMTAGDFHTTGHLSLKPKLSGLRELVVDDLKYDDNRVSGRIAMADDSTFEVKIAGSRFDVGPLLKPASEEDAGDHPRSALPVIDFEAEGVLTSNPEEFSIRDISARYGPSDIRGTLTIDRSGSKPSFAAEFRSDMVDLQPFFSSGAEKREDGSVDGAKAAPSKGDYAISDEPIALPILDRFDGTFRWKAVRFKGPSTHATDFEIGFELRDGHLRVEPLSASGEHGGSLTGQFDLKPTEQGFSFGSKLQLDGGRLQLSSSESDPGQWPTLDVDVNIDSHGRSLHELASHANGRFGLVLGEGDFPSSVMDYLAADILVELLQVLNPFATDQDETRLECAVVMLGLAEGGVTLEPFAVQTDRMTIVGGGNLNLATEKLRLDWITKPRQGVGLSASMITNNNIRLGGTLSHPAIEVKPVDAAVTTGVAVATLGLSLVARGLYGRITADQDVCKEAIEEAAAQLEKR